MQTIEAHPAEIRTPVPFPTTDPAPSNRGYDIALVAAIVGPLVALGGLIAVGVSLGVAVCATFFGVFAVTTTLDVRWLSRTRDVRRTSASRTRT